MSDFRHWNAGRYSPSVALFASVRGLVPCCNVYMKPNATLLGTKTFAMAVCFLKRRSARPIVVLRKAEQTVRCDTQCAMNQGAAKIKCLAATRPGSKRAVSAARDAENSQRCPEEEMTLHSESSGLGKLYFQAARSRVERPKSSETCWTAGVACAMAEFLAS